MQTITCITILGIFIYYMPIPSIVCILILLSIAEQENKQAN